MFVLLLLGLLDGAAPVGSIIPSDGETQLPHNRRRRMGR